MKIVNIFDAVRDGTYEDFVKFYSNDINVVSDTLGMNLLHLAVVNDANMKDKIKIIKFLISEGIDINFREKNTRGMHFILFIFVFYVQHPNIC